MLCAVRLMHDLSPTLRRRMLGDGCSLVVMRNGATRMETIRTMEDKSEMFIQTERRIVYRIS